MGAVTQKVVKQNEQSRQLVDQVLNQACIKDSLDYKAFNQVLLLLEKKAFKTLHDTPFAGKLFKLMDENSDGLLTREELKNGLREVINNKQAAQDYTFKSYDEDQDKRIGQVEFLRFFEQSWLAAFRILAQKSSQETEIISWSKKQAPLVSNKAIQLFRSVDTKNIGFIDANQFNELVYKTPKFEIRAQLDNLIVCVPLSLKDFSLN